MPPHEIMQGQFPLSFAPMLRVWNTEKGTLNARTGLTDMAVEISQMMWLTAHELSI